MIPKLTEEKIYKNINVKVMEDEVPVCYREYSKDLDFDCDNCKHFKICKESSETELTEEQIQAIIIANNTIRERINAFTERLIRSIKKNN